MITEAVGLSALKDRFRERLITPGDEEYDGARAVWNGMIDRRPALIVRCTRVADVVAAVSFARENALPVAIRGGSHNVAGYATCDGGMVIDLSLMRDIQVDPEARTVRVGGGATWGEVDQATQVYGLATPGGEVSVTGVAGLTLSGGVGYIRRKHGLSCDNLLSVEVVTADGRVLKASEEENTELFWAIRGGGGNFGVVTTFEFQLHPLGPDVHTVTIAYPFEHAKTVLRAWRAFTENAPDEVTSAFMAWSIPAVPDFPEELHGQHIIVLDGMYVGDTAEGERVLEPLRSITEPVFDLSGVTSYVEAQSAFDSFFPDDGRYYWKSLYVDELTDGFTEAMLDWVLKRPSLDSLTVIRHLGGAISRVGEMDTAFSNRDARFNLSIDASWNDPGDDEANVTWARAFWQDMRRFSKQDAIYLNFPGLLEEGETDVRKAFGRKYDRLVAIKRQYDPTNLFRFNANINPARGEGERAERREREGRKGWKEEGRRG